VDPSAIDADQYATIVELLLARGYEPLTGSKFQFQKMIRAFRDEEPVRRGLDAIREKFRNRDAEGPTWVAVFLSEGQADESERFRTDAFMTVSEVLALLA